jgi:hypothetical protein
MSAPSNLLEAIVYAAGEEIARDFNAAYRSTEPSTQAVAQVIDTLLCELQETGDLDAFDYAGSDSWNEAVTDMFGEPSDEDEEE